MLPLLTSSILRRAGFAHGFTTREGGISPPPYDTLDFAMLRDPSVLRENQARLGAAVGFDPAKLFQVTQVHGRAVLVAEGDPTALAKLEADALVGLPGSGAAVCVRVADCVPVLVADPASGRVAAVHAGWRGVTLDVLGAAIEAMGPAEGGFVAAIGPSIGPCCFEVGLDVAERIGAIAEEAIARRDDARGKAHVDLRIAVRRLLRRRGLADASIEDVPGCTRCDASRFYSFRRDADASGRLVGVIVAR